MKSRTVKIPKHLIVEELEHPEPYGDIIVVLANGMWTDAYIDDNQEMYTITNDRALINYLQKNNK